MRKSGLFLVLILVSTILMSYSIPSTIVEQQNMSKDFTTSGYTNTSSQSIMNFSETLEDDVLYYPDAYTNNSGYFDNGEGDYLDGLEVDSVYWSGTNETVHFNFTQSIQIEGFTYSYYGFTPGVCQLYVYENSGWADVFTVAFSMTNTPSWGNGTYYMSHFSDSLSFQFWDSAYIDYIHIDVIYMTLADSDHYAESFADVGDWSLRNCEADATLTTDGDVFSFETDVGVSDSDSIRSDIDDVSYGGRYGEVYLWANVSCTLKLVYYDTTPSSAIHTTIINLAAYTWTLDKEYISEVGVVGWLYISLDNQNKKIHLKVDYWRIAPAYETGWQYDGSTTYGIVVPDSSDYVFSDNDTVSLRSDLDWWTNSFLFYMDNTTTHARISTTYYQFLEYKVTSISNGDAWKVYAYDGSTLKNVQDTALLSAGIYRYNLYPIMTYVEYIQFNITQSCSLELDYIKLYSIANYTYSDANPGGSLDIDEYIYVDSGVLYWSLGTAGSIVYLNRDPALSVDTSYYSRYEMTTTSGSPEIDFYVGAWSGYTDDTTGILDSGTLTDIRFSFDESGNIYSIEFQGYETSWVTINELELIFSTPLDTTSADWLLILLGMCMIPASSLYLVWGGKKGASMNKLFWGLIAFALGWALVLGGIFA